MKQKVNTNRVQNSEITIKSKNGIDYICLTDMTTSFDGGAALIEQWLRNKDTVEFLGIWERINNPNFKPPEFEGFKYQINKRQHTRLS